MADKKISDFTESTTMGTGDLIEIETSGGNSRKVTGENLKKFVRGTITQYNPSGANEVDIALGTEQFYEIDYYLTFGTDAVSLLGEVTNDNFSTVETGAVYGYYDAREGTGGSATSSSDAGTSFTFQTPIGNAAGEFVQGKMIIGKAADASHYTVLHGRGSRLNATGQMNQDTFAGAYKVQETVNGIRLRPSSGTLTGVVIVRPIAV